MQKKKTLSRVILLFTAVLLLLSMALMTGCGKEEENDEPPYDVEIKVKSSLGDEWIFDLDTKELSCEYEYTGQKIDFYFDSVKMINAPQIFRERWFSNTRDPHIGSVTINCLYYDASGNRVGTDAHYRPAIGRGRYKYHFIVGGQGGSWIDLRAVDLFVTIK